MEFAPFVDKGTMASRYSKIARRKFFTQVPNFEETDGYVTGEFPLIRQPNDEELDKMVIFVALFIEPMNNPLANEKDFSFRRGAAMELAGIVDGDNLFEIITKGHPWCSAMISEYFRITQNLDYEAWFSYKMQFHKRAAAIRDNIDLSSKDLDLDILKKKVVEYESRLFPDERVRKMVEEDSTAMQNIRWAERYAKNYA